MLWEHLCPLKFEADSEERQKHNYSYYMRMHKCLLTLAVVFRLLFAYRYYCIDILQ